jgi:excisionase family DNA binding protein
VGTITREQAAGCLVKICEDWLRLLVRDGQPPPGPLERAVLARVAAGAPRVAAGCPRLLLVIGPRVAYAVKAQAIAEVASEAMPGLASPSGWLTTAQAAAALGLRADSVRWLLRRGRLDGHRTERGWRVDAASVRRRHGRPAA